MVADHYKRAVYKPGESMDKNRELEVLRMYLEEVRAVSEAREGEKERLLKEYGTGGVGKKERLIKLYLMDTLQIASEYREKGIAFSDLIQEANMGLLLALEERETEDAAIRRRIRETVEESLAAEGRESAVSEHMAEEINRLDEASKELAERNGQAPAIEELMEYLGMPEEEIREYMKISLDAINAGMAYE